MRTDRWVAMGVMLVLVGWAGILGAAEKDEVVMGEVVVTASRQAEETVKVPANVTVVTAEDIENSTAQNVAEVLGNVAGLNVTDITGNKRNYNVDIRGFGEGSQQNILLLVDGRRVNLPDLAGPDWNLVPLERIDRIEIIRGGRGNVLYGDYATAGVINIITKEGRNLEGTATVKTGSYNSLNGYASISGAHDIVSFDVSAGYDGSDGYRDNSDTEAKDFGANVRIDPTENLRLHLSGGYHEDDTRMPGALYESDFENGLERTDTTDPDNYAKTEDQYFKASLDISMLSNDTFRIETSVRNRSTKDYMDWTSGWSDADTNTKMVSFFPQLIFRGDFDGVSNNIIIGYDFNHAKQDINNIYDFGFGASHQSLTMKKEDYGFYVQDELGIGKALTLSGGYRTDSVRYTIEPISSSVNDINEDSYTVGINYAFNSISHVYGNYTEGFRYPNLNELYNSRMNVIDDLEAQEFNNYEIGISSNIGHGVIATLNLFYLETKDEIAWDAVTFHNVNVDGNTIRKGAEVSLAWQSKDLYIGGTYTCTDAEYDGGTYDGNEVPDVPTNRATAKVSYKMPFGLILGFDALYVGERYFISDFNNEADKADAYTVVNSKIQYPWRWLTFFVDLNNIFNEEYSAYNVYYGQKGYYPSPEFNFLVGVSARFGAI
jgi:iron complex outermembrane receptor protein